MCSANFFLIVVGMCDVGRGTCERNETRLTLLVLSVSENSCSESVLFISVANSSTVILIGHTADVVRVGVPRYYIYLKHLCLSYIGKTLSHHSILGQLKPVLNIVTVPFNIIFLCLVPGRKCSTNARSLLFGGIRFHYRPRCQVSCQIFL